MPGDCQRKYRRAFQVYDQAVDIISCWQSFTKYSYSEYFEDYYFDRFPTISQPEGDNLTPDFSIYFDSSYGIIGEIKRTFPDDDQAFRNTLQQLVKYDNDLPLQTSSGDERVPECCDVLLLLSGSDAPQIGTRIQDFKEQGEITFESNLVVLRYQYNTTADLSRYEFQRVPVVPDDFQDSVTAVSDEETLEYTMGEEGQYQTMKSYPKHFAPTKVKKPICNDEPPAVYLATILWHKIFPNYLSDSEYREWREGTAQKIIPIQTSVSEITRKFNQYLMNGTVRETWVRDSLEFLNIANLARDTDSGFEIKFRGIVRSVGNDNHQERAQDLDQIEELAAIFIERYCEYSDERQVREGQASIDEFAG